MRDPNFLQVYGFDKKLRLGSNKDGGYVIAELEGKYDCYISAGISDEESFSRDFINKYDMNKQNSYGFDGTIRNYPYQYTKNISFIRKNIGPDETATTNNMAILIEAFDDIFLKMDIEGGEYPWLMWIDEEKLNNFKQIVIEFHGINGDTYDCSYEDKVKCFKKLSNTHYLVHAHGNNHGCVKGLFPDIIELTYVNKKCFVIPPEMNRMPLPDPHVDRPNNEGARDIDLNFYPFVSPL